MKNKNMKIKKVIYVLVAVLAGILVSFIVHGIIEMLYLRIASDRGIAVIWTGSCALPIYLQIGLFVAGAVGERLCRREIMDVRI